MLRYLYSGMHHYIAVPSASVIDLVQLDTQLVCLPGDIFIENFPGLFFNPPSIVAITYILKFLSIMNSYLFIIMKSLKFHTNSEHFSQQSPKQKNLTKSKSSNI